MGFCSTIVQSEALYRGGWASEPRTVTFEMGGIKGLTATDENMPSK
jgi:hypothetical protein